MDRRLFDLISLKPVKATVPDVGPVAGARILTADILPVAMR
jgi:hypothetical protein